MKGKTPVPRSKKIVFYVYISLIIIAEVKKNFNILVTRIPQNDVHNVMLYAPRVSSIVPVQVFRPGLGFFL